MQKVKNHRAATPRFPGRGTLPALACLMAVGGGSPGLAESAGRTEAGPGCAGPSPVIEAMLSRTSPDVRPLMRIGEMQVWAIKDADGIPATALTTPDGLTILGRIIGPQGEDISAALLATVPDPDLKVPDPISAELQAPATTPWKEMAPVPESQGVPSVAASPALRQSRRELQADAASGTAPPLDAETPETPLGGGRTTAALTAIDHPSADVQAGLDLLFRQAGNERVWFSAGTPKPGAPVIYMLADPDCPQCQWMIDQMQGAIASGAIDLRIILAPVTGVQGFKTSLSILHSRDIPQSFMAHMTSKTRGTPAVAQMDTAQADEAVIQGIVDNINWMRANRMPGVPFFLYETDQGARFAFSELPPDALAAPRPAGQ